MYPSAAADTSSSAIGFALQSSPAAGSVAMRLTWNAASAQDNAAFGHAAKPSASLGRGERAAPFARGADIRMIGPVSFTLRELQNWVLGGIGVVTDRGTLQGGTRAAGAAEVKDRPQDA